MVLPDWIEPKITVGNILTIATLLGAVFGFAQAYGAMGAKVEQSITDIVTLRSVDADVRMTVIQLGKDVQQDRLITATTLAKLETDVGYIRRYVEDEKRSTRIP